jgi:hypothetical protein
VRIVLLVLLMCASLTVSAMVCLTLPVFLGRQTMALVLGKDSKVNYAVFLQHFFLTSLLVVCFSATNPISDI